RCLSDWSSDVCSSDLAEATGSFVTVEDHWPEGGLGDAVLAAFANGHQAPRITKLAVHTMPGSATPAEQLHAAGIDAKAIEAAVQIGRASCRERGQNCR